MDHDAVSLAFAAEDLDAVDAALATLEARLSALISLRPDMQREWARMGAKSEAFCRQTLAALAAQPQRVPSEFDLERVQADLAAADALHPRLLRLRRLTERAEDSEMALGCDVMVAALQGHALLAAAGCGEERMSLCEAHAA
jgi:hypothetical protein